MQELNEKKNTYILKKKKKNVLNLHLKIKKNEYNIYKIK